MALGPDVRNDDGRLAEIDATVIDSAETASLATVLTALGAAGEDRPPRVFVGYSRHDLDRARALAPALRARRLRVFLDLANLQPGEDWLARLYAYIDDADAVIFAISPVSLSSTVCADEVAHDRRAAG
ncbi:MAG TPA: toll/interleukin-1 receptor domain-containing protein [Vicinamibacterales bacterium]|nr:toll/interleukin-1 receptor domain-containing protein [Vicinamibacterales bacterium]